MSLSLEEFQDKLYRLSVLGVLSVHQEDGGYCMDAVCVKAGEQKYLCMSFNYVRADRHEDAMVENKCFAAWFVESLQEVTFDYPAKDAVAFPDYESAYRYLVKFLLDNETAIKAALADVFVQLKAEA